MVMKVEHEGLDGHQCENCGFKFEKEEHAKKCETACTTQGVCSNEIAKYTLKETKEEG